MFLIYVVSVFPAELPGETLVAHVVAELGDRVELRGRLGELVVHLGEAPRLHVLHDHADLDRRAAQLLAEALR